MTFQSLYKEIFGEDRDLEKVTVKFPYFTPAHFFRLQQTGPEENGYKAIAAKTALHFANPYLLAHQMDTEEDAPSTGVTTAIIPREVPAIAAEETVQSIQVEEAMEDVQNDKEPTTEISEEMPAIPPLTIPELKTDAPLFEPLHTTDYFASQGIKLSEVVLPGDKMGKQLKSFTEWLKTMKKVHPDGLKEKTGLEGSIDPSVQKLAERSNEEEEVLTESMAAVYIRQGRINKAKEIYEKLSLLNPSKSAYFAAKLNEIQ